MGGSRQKFAKFCLQPLLHKSLTTKRTNKRHKQTTQQRSYQTEEVKRNYKMFANPIFITPARQYVYKLDEMDRADDRFFSSFTEYSL